MQLCTLKFIRRVSENSHMHTLKNAILEARILTRKYMYIHVGREFQTKPWASVVAKKLQKFKFSFSVHCFLILIFEIPSYFVDFFNIGEHTLHKLLQTSTV